MLAPGYFHQALHYVGASKQAGPTSTEVFRELVFLLG